MKGHTSLSREQSGGHQIGGASSIGARPIRREVSLRKLIPHPRTPPSATSLSSPSTPGLEPCDVHVRDPAGSDAHACSWGSWSSPAVTECRDRRPQPRMPCADAPWSVPRVTRNADSCILASYPGRISDDWTQKTRIGRPASCDCARDWVGSAVARSHCDSEEPGECARERDCRARLCARQRQPCATAREAERTAPQLAPCTAQAESVRGQADVHGRSDCRG